MARRYRAEDAVTVGLALLAAGLALATTRCWA
jgi:hypothetical protein